MADRFSEKLAAAADRNQSWLCVGLDPDPDLMAIPDVLDFNKAIVDATQDLVCAYKPNLAFYDALGERGHRALRKTLDYIPSDIPVIGDSKRGDVESTTKFHAKAMFIEWGFDAATVNPFGGRDAVQPFLDYDDRGIFVWCRSTNPGAGEMQDVLVIPPGDEDPRPYYEWIATRAREWNDRGNVGLVAAATYPEELERIRELCPDMPILIPGVGTQRGFLERSVSAGVDSEGRNAIFNVSRSVIYASEDPSDFEQKARSTAEDIRGIINTGFAFQLKGAAGRPLAPSASP